MAATTATPPIERAASRPSLASSLADALVAAVIALLLALGFWVVSVLNVFQPAGTVEPVLATPTAVAPTTTLNFTSLMAGDTGPALDSVFVALVSTSGVPVEPNAGVALSPPSPNPSRQLSRVTFTLDEAAPVRLSVLDVAGREVARLAEGTYAAGNHEAGWDGRGPGGTAPAGLYFFALRVNGQKPLLQRMMRVR